MPSRTILPDPLGVMEMLALLAETMALPLTSRAPPNCGVVSLTRASPITVDASLIGSEVVPSDFVNGISAPMETG